MPTSTESPAPRPVLRPAIAADLPAIERLLIDSGLPTDGVAAAIGGFIVAERQDDARGIVGVIGLEACGDQYALLRSTAVAPEWRGTGLGRELVERAIERAQSAGLDALYLLTTTAERYFPAFGFEKTTRDAVPAVVQASGEFRGMCPASATVMSRALGDQPPRAVDRR